MQCYSTFKYKRFFEGRVSTVPLALIEKSFIVIFSSLALTSVWSLESFSVLPKREAASLHCSVKDSTCCTLELWKRVWYSHAAYNFRDYFYFFDSFGKSLSFSAQKTHSIRATVSVDDLRVALLCSSFWEPLLLERYFSCSTCGSMFFDTLLE